MKLKLVVASMSALGMVWAGSAAFAADTAAPAPNTNTLPSVKHVHHHRHHKRHHHHAAAVAATPASHPDYKGMGALPVAAAPVAADVCQPGKYDDTFNAMDHNTGRAMPNPCTKPVALAGGFNLAARFGNVNHAFVGENTQRVALNDVYLNFGGSISDYATAFASLNYANPSDAYVSESRTVSDAGQRNLHLNQAYIRLFNENYAPVFVQVGKQYQNYGSYTLFPPVQNVTQVLTQTLATSAEVGFVTPMGVHGSLSAFQGKWHHDNHDSADTNFVLGVGYDAPSSAPVGISVGAGYINDMTSVDSFNADGQSTLDRSYIHRVGGGEIHGRVTSGGFGVNAAYVTALKRFDANDYQYVESNGTTVGAKPFGWTLGGDYTFTAMDRTNQVGINYQATGQAADLGLPKHRWEAQYNVDVVKNVNVALVYDRDTDYGTNHGGTGDSYSVINLVASAKFG